MVLILICHVIAYGMLDRLVKETLGNRARVLLAMALANDQYRFAGRDSIGHVPLADHEMIEDLDLSHYPRRGTWQRADRYFVRAYLDRYQIPAGSPVETAPAPDSE